DVTRSLPLGNQASGIQIESGAQNNTVGGAVAGTGNVISGNQRDGVSIYNAGTSGNLVAGNTIGLDATATFALGNRFSGVAIDIGANGNQVGTAATGPVNALERNIIAASFNGLFIGGPNNNVSGNYIGINAAGAGGNGLGHDIGIGLYFANNTIGGPAAGPGNVISGNTGAPVFGMTHGLGIGIFGATTTAN